MRIVIDTFRDRKNRLEARIMDEDRIRDQLAGIDKELEEVKMRVATTSKNISDVSKSLKAAEGEEKILVEIEKRYAELSGSLSLADESLEREKERLETLMGQSASIREAESSMKDLSRKLVPGWEGDIGKNLLSKRKSVNDLNERIGKLRGKISEMKDLGSSLDNAGSKCPLCGLELTSEHRNGLIIERKERIAMTDKDIAGLSAKLQKVTEDIES